MSGTGASRATVVRLLERCDFPPAGTDVVCGVSGGADSVALLALAVEAGLRAVAVHVDHGVRPGGSDEAAAVAAVAERFGAGFRAERVVVRDGPDLEARCRAARHEALGPGSLLGHTMDDQAETVLWHLLRGSGLPGAAGIAPHRHPLLALRRVETRSLCDEMGIVPLQDPTNDDPRFTRNRLRHEVLPLLTDVARRDVVPLLARFADHARHDSDLLDALAADLDPTDARALVGTSEALARRAVRAWLAPVLGGLPPSAAVVDRVLAVARLEAAATEIGGGHRVERHHQRLHLVGPGESVADPSAAPESPGV